jgi:hypothetical protein
MTLGVLYPSMKEDMLKQLTRFAMRQYAINKEFELHVKARNDTKDTIRERTALEWLAYGEFMLPYR